MPKKKQVTESSELTAQDLFDHQELEDFALDTMLRQMEGVSSKANNRVLEGVKGMSPWDIYAKEEIYLVHRALDTSSITNRNLFVSFLLFVGYTAISISGTSDLMLFMPNSMVSLPIVKVDVPLFAFYLIMPMLLVAFHFNLLFNLRQHLEKIRLAQPYMRHQEKLLVYPFLFNYKNLEQSAVFRVTLRVIIWIIYYFTPLLVLYLAQLSFARYHEYWLSSVHYFLLLTDLIIVTFFWTSLSENNIKNIKQEGISSIIRIIVISLCFIALVLASTQSHLTLGLMLSDQAPSLTEIQETYHMPEELLPRLILNEQQLCPQSDCSGNQQGYMLRERDFRYADFSQANLHKADLKGADLYRANFTDGSLQETRLLEANLSLTDLQGASLNQSDLTEANLQGANLFNADLEYANLEQADLQGADILFADFEGANLAYANLKGIHTIFSLNVKGESLKDEAVRFTNMARANLRYADLRLSEMVLVNFEYTIMDHAKTWGFMTTNNEHTAYFEELDTTPLSIIDQDTLKELLVIPTKERYLQAAHQDRQRMLRFTKRNPDQRQRIEADDAFDRAMMTAEELQDSLTLHLEQQESHLDQLLGLTGQEQPYIFIFKPDLHVREFKKEHQSLLCKTEEASKRVFLFWKDHEHHTEYNGRKNTPLSARESFTQDYEKYIKQNCPRQWKAIYRASFTTSKRPEIQKQPEIKRWIKASVTASLQSSKTRKVFKGEENHVIGLARIYAGTAGAYALR